MFICDSDEDRWKAAQRFLKEQVIDGRIGDDIEEITDISQVPDEWRDLCVWHDGSRDITPVEFLLNKEEWKKARDIYLLGRKKFEFEESSD